MSLFKKVTLSVIIFAFLQIQSTFATGSLSDTEYETCSNLNPLVGEIDEDVVLRAHKIASTCLSGEGVPTRLIISSPGGSSDDALAAYEFLRNAPGAHKLTTVGVGAVSSAAVAIFLAGEHRHISCNTTILVHPSTVYIEEDSTYHSVREVTNSLKITADDTARLYAKRTGQEKGKMEELVRDHTFLNAQDAVKYGFAHEVFGECN